MNDVGPKKTKEDTHVSGDVDSTNQKECSATNYFLKTVIDQLREADNNIHITII